MTTKHTPATPLPEIAVNINGDLGVKDWRRDSPNSMTQRFTLDEKREVARRANAYPELVEALHLAHRQLSMLCAGGDWAPNSTAHAIDTCSALLHELGEE